MTMVNGTDIEDEWQDWLTTCLPEPRPVILEAALPILRDAFYAGAVSLMYLTSGGVSEAALLEELKAKARQRAGRQPPRTPL